MAKTGDKSRANRKLTVQDYIVLIPTICLFMINFLTLGGSFW